MNPYRSESDLKEVKESIKDIYKELKRLKPSSPKWVFPKWKCGFGESICFGVLFVFLLILFYMIFNILFTSGEIVRCDIGGSDEKITLISTIHWKPDRHAEFDSIEKAREVAKLNGCPNFIE